MKLITRKSKKFFDWYMRASYRLSKLIYGGGDKHVGIDQKIGSETALIRYAKYQLNPAWDYKFDKLFGLVNLIYPPTKASQENSGDCDDYASHLYYHAMDIDKITPYILTYFTEDIKSSHSVLIWWNWKNSTWNTISWGSYRKFASFKRLLTWYNDRYAPVPIAHYHLAHYNGYIDRFVKSRFYNNSTLSLTKSSDDEEIFY